MSALKTYQLSAHDCPGCGHRYTAALTDMIERRPGPGDFIICVNCQGLHVFDGNMQLRNATEAEIGTLSLEFLQRYQAAITAMKACEDARR